MPKKPQFKSDAFEAIHSGAKGLFQAGGIDKITLRAFDESYLTMPMEIEPQQIKLNSSANIASPTVSKYAVTVKPL